MRGINRLLFTVGIIIFSFSCEKEKPVVFTPEEQIWLSEHPKIVLAVDNTYPPLNYENKLGQLVGLNIDLVRLIERNLGITIVLEGSSWGVALEKAMNHEVDGVVNATPLEERKHKLNFTQGITRDPQALVCDKKNDQVSGFIDFQNKKVAAKRNSRQLLMLKERIPPENIIEVETLFEAFDLLTRNEIDGIYDDLAPLYHILSSTNMNNLKIALIEESEFGSNIGLRNDDPMLLKVINKAIDSITEEERKSAHEKWIQTGIVDYTKYYLALGVSVFILLLVLIWNYMLNAVVKRKTRQLTQELAERARLEKKLFKAIEKAEESDRLKSAFLANMSHEIRTPMNGIVGFSEMLTDPDLEPELREKYSKIVVDSGEQLLSIVNDILDISRIEAEEVEVNKETFEVNFLLDELCEFFRLKAQRKQIELIAEKESEESPVFIVSDKVKINQILSNLISNAIKFTSKGIIKVSYQLFSDEITFSVKDSGIGISAEMQSKIFDRFRQAELDLTRQYGGTGLGLSISEKLVKLLNGDIWLESTPQKGSTFYFKVPCERSNEKHIKVKTKQENMPSDTERKTKKTVLIAEDEEVNYLYLVEILNHAGIKHILAKNGQEAVNKCSSHPEIDLVLMDIKMPILNGLDATRKIKRLWPKLPIIAITAYALAGDKEKALEAGCDDYLAKPVKKEQLQEMLLRYL